MTKVCVEVGGSTQMNLTGYKNGADGTYVEILPANPDRVYLEFTQVSSSAIITFGAPYDPSSPGDVIPYTGAVVSKKFDTVVPVDAVYAYFSAAGTVTVFEGVASSVD